MKVKIFSLKEEMVKETQWTLTKNLERLITQALSLQMKEVISLILIVLMTRRMLLLVNLEVTLPTSRSTSLRVMFLNPRPIQKTKSKKKRSKKKWEALSYTIHTADSKAATKLKSIITKHQSKKLQLIYCLVRQNLKRLVEIYSVIKLENVILAAIKTKCSLRIFRDFKHSVIIVTCKTAS